MYSLFQGEKEGVYCAISDPKYHICDKQKVHTGTYRDIHDNPWTGPNFVQFVVIPPGDRAFQSLLRKLSPIHQGRHPVLYGGVYFSRERLHEYGGLKRYNHVVTTIYNIYKFKGLFSL